MIMRNEIGKSLYEKAHEHLKKYLKVKDNILDNEYVQLAGDFSKVVSFIRGANELIINKKFNSFLKGFSNDEIPTDDQIRKLINYIDDESKAEFISDTFTKVLLSNSSKSCLIMGTLLKSMVDDGGPLQHDKLICISALISFFDVDLVNYKQIFNFSEWYDTKKVGNKRKRFPMYKMQAFAKEKEIDYSSLLLTLEKAISSQLLIRTYEADIEVSYDKDTDSTDVDRKDIDEYYSFSKAGLMLKDYIDRINIIN